MSKAEEKLKEAKRLYETANADQKYVLESLFPELKESEDEKIRKALIKLVKKAGEGYENVIDGVSIENAISWLEKQGDTQKKIDYAYQKGYDDGLRVNLEMQGEQKPADKVEPKFKVGDWIIDVQGVSANQIIGYEDDSYHIKTSCSKFYLPMKLAEKNYRLWTIQDAKAGDVLADGNLPFIFKKIDANKYSYAYCGISTVDGFKIESDGKFGEWTWMQDIKPATKEQRDTLMKAMADAGYIFDFEKKELEKIEQKSAEWSEEDEKIYQSIMDDTVQENQLDGKQIDWLRNIKYRHFSQPQNTWKPSESDVLLLERIANGKSNPQDFQASLYGIIGQLKKLREE